MKKRQIGVWFSLALVIFGLSSWIGSKLGARLAIYRYHSRQHQSVGTLSAAEHAHLESVLDELDAISFIRLAFIINANDERQWKTLPAQMGQIETFRRKVNTPEAKPVVEMSVGSADVVASIIEGRSNKKELEANYMSSAQSIYQSLGWRDYSEDSLRDLAKRVLDQWKLDPQAKGDAQ